MKEISCLDMAFFVVKLVMRSLSDISGLKKFSAVKQSTVHQMRTSAAVVDEIETHKTLKTGREARSLWSFENESFQLCVPNWLRFCAC